MVDRRFRNGCFDNVSKRTSGRPADGISTAYPMRGFKRSFISIPQQGPGRNRKHPSRPGIELRDLLQFVDLLLPLRDLLLELRDLLVALRCSLRFFLRCALLEWRHLRLRRSLLVRSHLRHDTSPRPVKVTAVRMSGQKHPSGSSTECALHTLCGLPISSDFSLNANRTHSSRVVSRR